MVHFMLFDHNYLRASAARWRVRWHHAVAQSAMTTLLGRSLLWRDLQFRLLLERISLEGVQERILVLLSVIEGLLLAVIIRCDDLLVVVGQ